MAINTTFIDGTTVIPADWLNNVNTFVNSGAGVTFVGYGGALGTPTSGTLTNCTGLPITTGVSGMAAGVGAFLATPSSANLKTAMTDETGSGAIVFANTPTLVTPVIGAATGTSLIVSGAVRLTGASSIGYNTGAGGTIAQATSRTTSVILNKTTGQITLFSAAGSATPTTFTVSNSTVTSLDTIVLSAATGTNKYLTFVTAVGISTFDITFYTTGGTAVDAPVINFSVIKGAIT